jgi:hypothetical protein
MCSPTSWRALLSVLNFQLARIQRRLQNDSQYASLSESLFVIAGSKTLL